MADPVPESDFAGFLHFPQDFIVMPRSDPNGPIYNVFFLCREPKSGIRMTTSGRWIFFLRNACQKYQRKKKWAVKVLKHIS